MQAYACGAFPMAAAREAIGVDWLRPDLRAILPLESFHIRRSLARGLRRCRFDLRCDTAFDAVIAGCAAPRSAEVDGETWINAEIRQAFLALHQLGLAHSLEAWQDGTLVGGLYGLRLGDAFFAESMYSAVSLASQFCLVALVDQLKASGATLLDVQFANPHLEQFGVVEIPLTDYLQRLADALPAALARLTRQTLRQTAR